MRETSRRVLDPVERVSEVLFGLIMVLTFTGSISASTAGRADIREMLVGAVGCNIAWGIVDAVMYVMTSVLNRGRGLKMLEAMQASPTPEHARAILADAIHPTVARMLQPSSLDAVRQDLAAVTSPPRASVTAEDLRGAAEVFLLVFLSTLPVVLPFVLMAEPTYALRVSNAIAVTMLCAGGYSLGHYAGLRPWWVATSMTALGVLLVGLTIALGG